MTSSDESKEIYYGVYHGIVPGVYTSFSLVQEIVSRGGIYKEFTNIDNACLFAASGRTKMLELPQASSSNNTTTVTHQNKNDNSTSKNGKKPDDSKPSCSNGIIHLLYASLIY